MRLLVKPGRAFGATPECLRRLLLGHHLADVPTGVFEKGVRIDPGIADRLRAMGYLR